VREFVALTEQPSAQPMLPHLIMPPHHDVRSSDVFTRRLHGTLAAAAERGPVDFPELLLSPGVGARTVQSLAMVAEVVHGAPYRFSDPARFSLAHGGKDRHPYPVPIKVYDETIRVLKSAVQKAKLGRDEEVQTLKRLDDQARQLERMSAGPSLDAFIAAERSASASLGGRSVFGWEETISGNRGSPTTREGIPIRQATAWTRVPEFGLRTMATHLDTSLGLAAHEDHKFRTLAGLRAQRLV
jgi:uncharacterized protein